MNSGRREPRGNGRKGADATERACTLASEARPLTAIVKLCLLRRSMTHGGTVLSDILPNTSCSRAHERRAHSSHSSIAGASRNTYRRRSVAAEAKARAQRRKVTAWLVVAGIGFWSFSFLVALVAR
jgi:hypothetical protein